MLFALCYLSFAVSGVYSAFDVVNQMKRYGHYNQTLSLLNQTGLASQLLAADKITLFAPTDEAFAHLPAQELADLKSDPKRLKNVLQYHTVIGEAVPVSRTCMDQIVTSATNQPIRLNRYAAFGVYAAQGVTVVRRNTKIANGLFQGIDRIMTPPSGNIVEILSSRPDMTNLTSLLTSAKLIDGINADMNMTLFAPTDSAFANVDDDVMEWLTKHPNSLKDVLRYHTITAFTLYKVGMHHSMSVGSGDQRHDRIVVIEDFNGNVFVDRAKVSELDISATNGVIHVIDDVMIPLRVALQIEQAGVSLG